MSRARHWSDSFLIFFFRLACQLLGRSSNSFLRSDFSRIQRLRHQEPREEYAMPPPRMPPPAASDEEGTNFMNLPVECRIKVYRNLLEEDKPFKISVCKSPSGLNGAYHPTLELIANLTLAQATSLSAIMSRLLSSRLGQRRRQRRPQFCTLAAKYTRRPKAFFTQATTIHSAIWKMCKGSSSSWESEYSMCNTSRLRWLNARLKRNMQPTL